MIFLSYLGAHWLLVIIVVLGTVFLTALAWVTKNLKFVIAAVLLVIMGLAYQAADMEGYKRKVTEDAQVQVNILKQRLLAVSIVSAEDAKHAKADADLNNQMDQLSRETPKNDGVCLDADAARRVRAIGGPKPVAAPVPARRHSVVLPWRRGRP